MDRALVFENLTELAEYLREEMHRPVTEHKLRSIVTWEPPYGESDIEEIIAKLDEKKVSKWKEWAKRNMERIIQKEDLLWSRPRYQRSLNDMADKWGIPREGFAEERDESLFIAKLQVDQNQWPLFKAQIEQIVVGQSSSRLRLGNEWTSVVERHLLSRERGRLAAQLMAAMMSPPQVKVEYDRWGEPVAVCLSVESGTPEVVISEYKKELKNLEQELGIKPKRRENISPKRERAKALLGKPTSEILLQSDMKLRQRYKKQVKG